MAFAQLTYRESLLDLHGNIPAFIDITPAKIHEIHILDEIVPEPGSIYIADRACLDFERLYRLQQGLAFFIIRPRKDFSLFEKVPLLQAFSHIGSENEIDVSCNKLELFDL
jgi:hypothetical protein